MHRGRRRHECRRLRIRRIGRECRMREWSSPSRRCRRGATRPGGPDGHAGCRGRAEARVRHGRSRDGNWRNSGPDARARGSKESRYGDRDGLPARYRRPCSRVNGKGGPRLPSVRGDWSGQHRHFQSSAYGSGWCNSPRRWIHRAPIPFSGVRISAHSYREHQLPTQANQNGTCRQTSH